MASVIYRASDNGIVIDRVTNPLTGEQNIADATVTVTLKDANGANVTGAINLSAPWNATLSAYVAELSDVLTLTANALYYAHCTVVRGSDKRTLILPLVAKDY